MTIGETIKRLLESGNQVILPGFGNLKKVETVKAASPSGKHLDPPGVKIRFNSSFSKDDGLLARTWAEDGQVDDEEANQRVLELVDAIRFALDKGEVYELAGAGKFRRDDDGKVHFTPEKGWTLHPDQFGLESLEIEELKEEKAEEKAEGKAEEKAETKPEMKTEKESQPPEPSREQKPPAAPVEQKSKVPPKEPLKPPVIKRPASAAPAATTPLREKEEKPHRKTRLWKVIWIVAGVLVVVLAVLLFVPAEKLPFLSGGDASVDSTAQQASGEEGIQMDSAAGAGELPETEVGEVQPGEITSEEIPEVERTEELTEEPMEEITVPEVEDRYFLIAGSFSSVVNASDLQDKLKAQGYNARVISTENRMYRVSVASFTDKREAERELSRLKQKPGLEAIWLLVNE